VAPAPVDDGPLTVFVTVMSGLLLVTVIRGLLTTTPAPVLPFPPVILRSKTPPLPVEDEPDEATPEPELFVTVTKGKKKFRVRADSTGVLASSKAASVMQHVAARLRVMLLFLELVRLYVMS
jgi:hypothetical protein